MALNHVLIKPEKIVSAGIGLLEQELLVPNTFQKESVDQFKGAANDTVNVTVEGLLPFHDFMFRSGEQHAVGTSPYQDAAASPQVRDKLVFDRYVERSVPISFQGNVYSAVEITDEQKDFDFGNWTDKILKKQIRAVGRGLGWRAVDTLVNAPYEVEISGAGRTMRNILIEARRVLNRFNIPQEGRVLLVGTDFESALIADPDVVFARASGDAVADTALHEATLGRAFGFDIVVDTTIPSDQAYAYHPFAFVMVTGAPSVPQSVNHGATASYEGLAMRWLTDYSADFLVDRSVVNMYAGFRHIQDNLIYWDPAMNSERVTETEHFVRAIKIDLDGADLYPAADAELAIATGINGPGAHLSVAAGGAAA